MSIIKGKKDSPGRQRRGKIETVRTIMRGKKRCKLLSLMDLSSEIRKPERKKKRKKQKRVTARNVKTSLCGKSKKNSLRSNPRRESEGRTEQT